MKESVGGELQPFLNLCPQLLGLRPPLLPSHFRLTELRRLALDVFLWRA